MLAVKALSGLIQDTENNTLTMMQLLGKAIDPISINSEIEDLRDVRIIEPLFTFQRYDMKLDAQWLRDELGMNVSSPELSRLQQMELPEMMPRLWELAEAAAEKLIVPDHIRKMFKEESGYLNE